jgi:hypothetical protein
VQKVCPVMVASRSGSFRTQRCSRGRVKGKARFNGPFVARIVLSEWVKIRLAVRSWIVSLNLESMGYDPSSFWLWLDLLHK